MVSCASGFQTHLDDQGYYTYVVAAPAEAAQVHDPALTVLAWGSASVPNKVVFLRNMLPSPQFYPWSVQAAQARGADLATSMGAYYPRATYCDISVVTSRGYQDCYR
ncbi:hypothetical protein [Nocardia sp. NPDC060259]|uniref:hypothetical protein n=1 Tax=Nocardia sp. NPDC060259 TaxID=3347088 RepID=UPI0036540B27